jgi:tetraacyldisaccharide 4'-kinase
MFSSFFYGLCSTVALPFAISFAISNEKLRNRLKERFLGGDWPTVNFESSIWIHAASVGELQGVKPLLEQLCKLTSDPIVITTTSNTGRDYAASFKEVAHSLLVPYDHPWLISVAIRKLKPKCFLLFETELWPNLLTQLRIHSVPLVLINGRISDKTYPTYLRLKPMLEPALRVVSKCLVQTEKDKRRFIELGGREVTAVGSTKYDSQIPDLTAQANSLLKDFDFPESSKLIVAGSVRPGESEIILKSFKDLKAKFPEIKLLLAPRHPERYEAEATLVNESGLKLSRRSALVSGADVYLLDSLGELKTAYAASTISFVGGTLTNIGGHNPLEPAMFKKPMLIGPFTQNVEQISNDLVENGGAIRVVDSQSFTAALNQLLIDPNYSQSVGENAFRIFANHQGALAKVLTEITPLLEDESSNKTKSEADFLNPLVICSKIYLGISSVRNFLYDNKILSTYRSILPVVCVGNITAGGNAKSPVTQAIAKLLLRKNFKPVILLRGYGGTTAGPIEVTSNNSVILVGDEAAMHKAALPEVSVVVSRSRVDGAKFIEEKKLGDLIILDDGFQHRALERDINLALFDKSSVVELKKGDLLPVGRLRESVQQGLRRADAVGFVERGETYSTPSLNAKVEFRIPLAFADLTSIQSGEKIDWNELRGKSVSAVASIAKPESFKRMLEEKGLVVVKTIFKPDHANWAESDLKDLESLPGEFIISTSKDSVKLKSLPALPERLLIAGLSAEISDNFEEWIVRKLSHQ